MKMHHILFGLPLCVLANSALAVEYPIGEPQSCGGMEIAAVYLQPIEMDPPGMMRDVADSDAHIEADISATEDNENGFQEGSWVPYLNVSFELTKEGGSETIKGHFHPMVANDGPHYGDNVKMDGPGNYHLKFTITPPGKESMFGRHIDQETGVAPWFSECVTEYDFTFAGTGKKGGY